MRLTRCFHPLHAAARRPTAAVCLAAYLLTWLGVPLPGFAIPVMRITAEATDGDNSDEDAEPYPCQDCHCHCSSAEQCWQGCCCFTMTERIEWSREHGVAPPSWVLQLPAYQQALAELEARSTASPPAQPRPAASCAHCQSHAVCPPGAVARESSCTTVAAQTDAQTALAPATGQSHPKPSPRERSPRWLILLEAQACLGTSLNWVTTGAALPIPPYEGLQGETAIAPAPPTPFFSAPSASHEPPVPPPREFAL